MDRISVTQSLIDRLNAKTYVEIGVSWGHCYLSIRAKRKYAVDPVNRLPRHLFWRPSAWSLRGKAFLNRWFTRLGWEDSRFFEMTSDDFFQRVPHLFSGNKIDVAFIDGLHTYEQAYRDVENCLKFLAPGGVIVMHDCNPTSEAMAVPATSVEDAASKKVPGWDGLWCGDVWKAVVDLRRQKDLEVFVLDCDMGLGIVSRRAPEAANGLSREDVRRMTYADLARDRKALLGLREPAYFEAYLNKRVAEQKTLMAGAVS